MPSSNVAWDINGSVADRDLHSPRSAQRAHVGHVRRARSTPATAADSRRRTCACSSYAARAARSRPAPTSPSSRVRSRRGRRRLRAAARRGDRSHSSGCRSPTIAEVDGAAAGGGCAIALACDIRICSDRARVRRAGGAHARQLPVDGQHRAAGRLVGPARLRDLLLTGRLIDAPRRSPLGLATRDRRRRTQLSQATCNELAAELATRAPQHDRRDEGDAASAARSSARPPEGSADDIIRRVLRQRQNSARAWRRSSRAARRNR